MPVIAVGNFTAGGAGKTPTVAALVRLASTGGLAPAVVTRGHGGRLAGPVRVDPQMHGAGDVGDEALLHARIAPTFVARDRLAGARAAVAAGARLVLLDDGLQNPRLAKDLALVVVDRAVGIGTGLVQPAGPLRVPMATQWTMTDALVVIDSGEGTHPTTEALVTEAVRRGLPVFTARIRAREPEEVAGRRVVAFAGIGRPEKFMATLEAIGADVVELVDFPDHHPFTADEATALLSRAARADADLVTTEKDAARFGDVTEGPLARLVASTRVLAVDLVFDDPVALARLVAATVTRRLGGSA